jgi:ubiquitin carboxyl-terminal hydrolase 8
LFRNRDKFDIIAIYDEASKTPGSPDEPISSLIRAIYETAFRKALKRVPVLLIGGLEAWKREFGDEELEVQEELVDPVPSPIPLAQPAAEVYMPPSPQPPAPQISHVSRTSPPGVPLSSPKPDQPFRALPPVPRSPLPNRSRAGTESVPEARPLPAPDNPRRSVDQGPISPRYGYLYYTSSPCKSTDLIRRLSHPESGDMPSEPVRRLQRKPTMTRPPSISSLSSFPRTMSEGVRLSPPRAVILILVLMARTALLPPGTAHDAQRPHTIPPDRTHGGSAQLRFFLLQRFGRQLRARLTAPSVPPSRVAITPSFRVP